MVIIETLEVIKIIVISGIIGGLIGASIMICMNQSSIDEAWRRGFEAGEKYIKERG